MTLTQSLPAPGAILLRGYGVGRTVKGMGTREEPQTLAEALAAGRINCEQAQVIARALADLEGRRGHVHVQKHRDAATAARTVSQLSLSLLAAQRR